MPVHTLLAVPNPALPHAAVPNSALSDSLLLPTASAQGPAPAARASAAPAAPLRLTRRGRLVLIGLPAMLTAAAALTMLGFFTAPAEASGGGPDVTRTIQVSVSPGESLWGLADEYAPDRDPRDVVADMMELNNLSDARIPVGVQLFVPVTR